MLVEPVKETELKGNYRFRRRLVELRRGGRFNKSTRVEERGVRTDSCILVGRVRT